ncbi:MAG TPA: hypothetical protein VNU97_08910 [Rhizomicrobium sp.]|jgi:hypothetical protein|nr:hypothetical protein [Rhizomicrobium sp.]
MRMNLIAAGVVAAGLALFAPMAASAAPQDFELTNSTGYEIKSVFIGEHSSDSWGDDILGQDTLADGAAVKIHFPGGRGETCDWDLKVTYTVDGTSAEWTDGFDLCTITAIDIKWDGHTTSATYQ